MVQPIQWMALQPYVSLIILEGMATDHSLSFDTLFTMLTDTGRQVPNKVTATLAESPPDTAVPPVLAALGIDQVAGFVQRHERPPAWITPNVGYLDTWHELLLLLRRGRFVVVRAEGTLSRRVQSWLNKPARPYRRIDPTILEGAMLQGAAKGLWLKDIRSPNVNRALSKVLNGPQLQSALDPMGDSSYSMGSGTADMADDGSRLVLNGLVGTTLSDSSVWFKGTPDLNTFGLAVVEILTLIEAEQTTGPRVAIPFVARPVTDLSLVHGAYDITIVGTDQLPSNQADDETEAAALLLQDVTFGVEGTAGPDLRLEVGFGSVSGTLLVTTTMVDSRCVVATGPDPSRPQTDQKTVQDIASALESHPELLSIHYRSGHGLINGQMVSEEPPSGGFVGWSFEDFGGYVVTQEKPEAPKAQERHDLIGTPVDKSLFGWVARRYTDGWLTCDDGPGEVADFIHIARDLTLSLIHVKGANSASPGRGVATTAYEVVASQASKNSVYLINPQRLREELEDPGVDDPATWTGGVRVATRDDFLAALDRRDATSLARVIIVQPHLTRTTFDKLNALRSSSAPSDDLLRLMRLEDMLHGVKVIAVARKADLTVFTAQK